MKKPDTVKASNFIAAIIKADIEANKNDGKVMTRFPPEPNGYLHIGHAKSICLNFGLAEDFNGLCNLRFDEFAIFLIKKGKAYVDSLNAEEIRQYRGTLTEPGKESPYRDRSVDENLNLFERMRNGEFPDGKYVLRAKIDMSSICVTRYSTEYYTPVTTEQVTNGAFIRCMTLPMVSPIQLRE